MQSGFSMMGQLGQATPLAVVKPQKRQFRAAPPALQPSPPK